MTDPEVKEMLDEVGRRSDAEFAADAARQERDKERYDPEREQARLSLLEQESILSRQREEMVELRTGRYPAMGDERRTAKIEEIEHATNDREARIAMLASIVGDREDDRRQVWALAKGSAEGEPSPLPAEPRTQGTRAAGTNPTTEDRSHGI